MASIMLCDDDKESAEVLSTLLSKRGFTVVRPAQFTSIEALVAKEKPDVVLMDMCLPEVNTTDIIGHIRASGFPVIGFSGMQGWREEAMAAGCHSFLDKPFHLRDLLELLEQIGIFAKVKSAS
jgi:CheY-like chemotaxis protein